MKSNPTPIVSQSWQDIYYDCPEYEDCFDYGTEQNWHFWSCAGCPLYKKTSKPPSKVLLKSPKPHDKPKPTPGPPPKPQPKIGLWQRIVSTLGGQ